MYFSIETPVNTQGGVTNAVIGSAGCPGGGADPFMRRLL